MIAQWREQRQAVEPDTEPVNLLSAFLYCMNYYIVERFEKDLSGPETGEVDRSLEVLKVDRLPSRPPSSPLESSRKMDDDLHTIFSNDILVVEKESDCITHTPIKSQRSPLWRSTSCAGD